MGRFIYVPIDFDSNKDSGLEREVLIKRSSDDLYVLDDFKVPVSATKKLKEEYLDIDSTLDFLLEKITGLNDNFFKYINQLKTAESDLEECIKRGYNDLFKRNEVLRQDALNLEEYLNQVVSYFNHNKTNLDDEFNNYKLSLDKLISESQIKYDNENSLFNIIKQWLDDYNTKINKINIDIEVMKNIINSKQDYLGEGNGSWHGKLAVPTDSTVEIVGHCYWLGNSATLYGGELTGSGYGGAYWDDDEPRHIDKFFGTEFDSTAIDRIDSSSPLSIDEMGGEENILNLLKQADEDDNLIEGDQYWDGDLEYDDDGWVSESTGVVNHYRKKVTVHYIIQYKHLALTDI